MDLLQQGTTRLGNTLSTSLSTIEKWAASLSEEEKQRLKSKNDQDERSISSGNGQVQRDAKGNRI